MEHNREYAKEVSKKVKEYFKKQFKKPSVTMTQGVKYPYITLNLGYMSEDKTSLNDRKVALDVIYGEDFARCESNIAGNVQYHTIAMKPHEWDKFLEIVNK